MQIQVNTDRNIEGHEALTSRTQASVEAALSRFSDRITRVEVHLSDENSAQKGGGDDMRCVIEVRMDGQPPLAVTHKAATMDQAIDGAADKLERKLDSLVGRQRDQRTRTKDGSRDPLSDTDPDSDAPLDE